MNTDARIVQLLKDQMPVHMLGIGGVGMAGLACLLSRYGVPVSGCDTVEGPLVDWLDSLGIAVATPHAPEHLNAACGWVIRSAAVSSTEPECQAALGADIPVFTRGQVLPVLLRVFQKKTVAVCGTHGKTTCSSLCLQLLSSDETSPGWCIGGWTDANPAVADPGSGNMIVVEADESDGSLAYYTPDITVLTNVDFDHMERFESVSSFEACFESVLRHTRCCVVVCADDARALAIAQACVPDSVDLVRVGTVPVSELLVSGIHEEADGQCFALHWKGQALGEFRIPLAGRHNVLNTALAVGVMLTERGEVSPSVASRLAELVLPKRRFEIVWEGDDCRILSDYAHHPAELRALIEAAKSRYAGRLRMVFQPHRYSRTKALCEAFPAAFAGLDELVLLPVYPASEQPINGGQIWDLYTAIRNADGTAGPQTVWLADSCEQVLAYYRKTLRSGDTLLIAGAGDVDWIARQAAGEPLVPHVSSISVPGPPVAAEAVIRDVSLGRRTTLGIGGTADMVIAVSDCAMLAQVLLWCEAYRIPCHVHGAGSNILVSDLGVRGVTLMLDRHTFGGIRREAQEVIAGAACRLSTLLDWCETQGLSGLEFLEGIPGTVGGAVHMNAGAWGRAMENVVDVIQGLSVDGQSVSVANDHLEFGYRACKGVRGMVVLEARFRLLDEAPEAIRARRREYAERRHWMKKARCAGSVFRNPSGGYAGALIESAGLKGFRIGGVFVSDHNANVMLAEPGASASDMEALIGFVKDRVERLHGVTLELEIKILR